MSLRFLPRTMTNGLKPDFKLKIFRRTVYPREQKTEQVKCTRFKTHSVLIIRSLKYHTNINLIRGKQCSLGSQWVILYVFQGKKGKQAWGK